MKKTMILAAIAAATLPLRAQEAKTLPADTVLSVANATHVVLTESPHGVELTVRGTAADPAFAATFSTDYAPDAKVTTRQRFAAPFQRINRKGLDDHTDPVDFLGGLHAGFCGAIGQEAPLAVQMSKSFELGIDNIIAYRFYAPRKRNFLSIGVGINWRNWRMTANTRFITLPDGTTEVGGYPAGVESRFSRVKMFSLGFPILWHQSFRAKAIGKTTFALKLGAILNWNSHASVLTLWDDPSGQSVKTSTNRIGQRKFSVDLMAAVRLAPHLGVYAKYSPMKVFRNAEGPSFSPLSAGIYIGF